MTIPNNATQDKRTATSSKPPKKNKMLLHEQNSKHFDCYSA